MYGRPPEDRPEPAPKVRRPNRRALDGEPEPTYLRDRRDGVPRWLPRAAGKADVRAAKSADRRRRADL